MKTLLISDDPSARDRLRARLQSRGHEIATAAGVAEARRVLVAGDFPMIILNLSGPEPDILEACRTIRASPRCAEAFLMVVFHDGNEKIETLLDDGASDGVPDGADSPSLNLRLSVAERHVQEIGKRKQAEENARRSEERFKFVIGQMPGSTWVTDTDLRITSSLGAGLADLGLKPNQLAGVDLVEFLGSNDPEYLPVAAHRRALRGESASYEQEWRGRIFQTSIEPLRDTEGRITGCIGMALDITGLKKAESALRESASRLRAIFETSPECIKLLSPDGTLLEMNRAGLAMMETDSLEQVVGMKMCQIVSPSYRPAFESLLESVARGTSGTLEFEITGFRGTRRLLETHCVPLRDPEGKIVATLGVTRDVTARKYAEDALRESECRYRHLFEESKDPFYITTREGRFVDVNQAWLDLTGYTREEVAGLKVQDVYAKPEDRKKFQAEIELKGSLRDYETRHRKKDGSEIVCLNNAGARRDRDGNIVGYQGIIHDVTERRRMEQAMLHAQKLESLGVLAGGIAHDFNNLLAVVLGNIDLALHDLASDSPAREHLKQIEVASHRGAELCKQMLAYSGKGRFLIQPVDLNHLVHEITHLLEVSISKKVVLRFNLAPALPAVEADATQVRQVVMNLVVNASDAIGDKSGAITLSTGLTHADRSQLAQMHLASDLPEGEYVYVEVVDTGCGMDAATKAKIFDPFFTTKFSGRGLGLAAVLGIVRGHRGAIWIESEPGRGSAFRFLLPCLSRASRVRPKPAPPSEEWHGSGTVLVADDEESFRGLIAQMAGRLGFKVMLAADGKEAVDLFCDHAGDISLVLLDLTMPRVSGEEAFREIQLVRPGAKVLLMSGYSEEDASGRFAGKGLAGFIQKPFTLDDLRRKIQSALQTS
ncbi:MAG: PAS domain S-box protein [Verrucomicrobia bacterium]|nr:PAS domain S-box protein [Verrucomicrobiota bacterium]